MLLLLVIGNYVLVHMIRKKDAAAPAAESAPAAENTSSSADTAASQAAAANAAADSHTSAASAASTETSANTQTSTATASRVIKLDTPQNYTPGTDIRMWPAIQDERYQADPVTLPAGTEIEAVEQVLFDGYYCGIVVSGTGQRGLISLRDIGAPCVTRPEQGGVTQWPPQNQG